MAYLMLPAASWHEDPTGRFRWRWWDGQRWTDMVSDGGQPTTDAAANVT